jgi:CheY-like chemotaxis protein
MAMYRRPYRVLLVEDNPADVRLLQEAFRESRDSHEIHIVEDGHEALDFMYRRFGYTDKPRPDLILLDINLPKLDGYAVLDAVKSEPEMMRIPVIMLTSSDCHADVMKAYNHRANAYIQKPSNIADYFHVAAEVTRFWLGVVELPPVRC